ncbi:MAG TPA: hypothetical protein DDZ84_11930, partial [Firmicutes bacterium]|nr:hypothetical protein [Bacillota bacterium]
SVGAGCAFAPRCERRTSRCEAEESPLVQTRDGRVIRCHAGTIVSL